ncbi:hypothetical protein CROQUDRAFT_723078 [Cronartium quercuum f. sp. fusiforme G11]|uniref:Mid2 domain-containing protein n=1 Tax=Cronartium quercuum f. sp. fusiforme G11 TaxID=708437 RepID=A0A9P6NM70_9BASI|nr:hypothetical protein CROQUDRAFT_723078 [Cronartium quercuum f. sp. fusiforme G11]
MDNADDCNCYETTIVSTITGTRHNGKSQSVQPTQTFTTSQYNIVTVVVQVGLYPSGISIIPISSLTSTNTSLSTSLPLPSPTDLITQPSTTQNVQLIATSSTYESQSTSLDAAIASSPSKPALPIVGAVIGGLVGLVILVGLISVWTSWARHKRDRDALDMMAPSTLPDAYVRATKEHRRVSTVWFDSREKADGL